MNLQIYMKPGCPRQSMLVCNLNHGEADDPLSHAEALSLIHI